MALLLGVPQAGVAEDILAWLHRAGQAAASANFEGTFASMNGSQLQVMHIRQGRNRQGLHQRLVTLSGERCEIVRNAQGSAVVYPNLKLMLRGRPHVPHDFMPHLSTATPEIHEHYHAELVGHDRVADRNCRVIRFRPRDQYRYGCELCLDTSTGLPLRFLTMTQTGETLQKYEFTALQMIDSMQQFPSDSFRVQTNTQGFEMVGMPYNALPPTRNWVARELPPGFQVRKLVRRYHTQHDQELHHLVVTDPLSSVSVFIESRSRLTGGILKRKMRHAYTTQRDGYGITVIGDVPEETIRMIGESLYLLSARSISTEGD